MTTGSEQLIDTTTEFGTKAARRLAEEQVVWLTTVGPSGTPQPNPVWFLWRDGEFLLFSQPDRPKLRNIAGNPRVSVNLNSTASGGDVVVLTGTARVDEATPAPEEIEAYVEKYTEGLVSISMTREQFFEEYSVPVRITPDRLRGF
ncbi:TIGR03667 family PPOX class F420-dependent oxidoreductase [Nocardia cyriacigeorgica]|uniref:TIGR03667 family PPOX class F420-dependent oxidoreductase n=1 Tax=Nocardia cyriacigeorgica TaxID=135487 RepID=UPI0024547CC0|nr:TIGR03667 family PPOX class F420-dependent oxidoreductase [Nocardia cyriacigeorgica]